jgi:hypothetical protein
LRYALLSAVIGGVGLVLSRFAAEGLLGIFQITLPCALVYVLLLLALRDPVWRVLR